MGFFDYISTFLPLAVIVAVAALVIVRRRKYRNKSNAGAFFFENDSLVLNTGIPHPIPLTASTT